jgi:transposase-like protein
MTLETGVIPSERAAIASKRGEIEVSARPERRRFTTEYKRRILQEADACTKSGELGALLRREGLYSSHLAAWRAARARGELSGLNGKKRGPKPKPVHPEAKRILQLEGEVRKLRARAERAEALVELQKKVAALLGNELPQSDEES